MVEVNHSMMKLGKQPVRLDDRTLHFRTYMSKILPTPKEYGLSSKITNLGVMLNNQLGDCTCAAVGHLIQAWTAELGNQVIPSDAVILKLYEDWCGYNPADPESDQGGNELSVLNSWRKHPVENGKFPLEAYVAVNFKDPQKIRESIYYFGGTYTGVALPLAWQTTMVWDVVQGPTGIPGSWGLHAVPFVDYNEIGPIVISWGMKLQVTWAAVSEYFEEAYCLLSPTIFSGEKSIEGFSLEALKSDLLDITG